MSVITSHLDHHIIVPHRVQPLHCLSSAARCYPIQAGDGKAFRRAMARKHVLVRAGTSVGLPDCVRIATRALAEKSCLLSMIHEVRR